MNIGVDILKISRIEEIYKKYGDKLLEKVFTEKEKSYIKGKNNNIETIAGMISAKESISKAVGTGIGRIGWKDMEVVHDKLGRPEGSIINKNKLGELKLVGKKIKLSISHEEEYTISFVIIY